MDLFTRDGGIETILFHGWVTFMGSNAFKKKKKTKAAVLRFSGLLTISYAIRNRHPFVLTKIMNNVHK